MATTRFGDTASPSPAHPGPAAVRAALGEFSDGQAAWDEMLDRFYAKSLATGSFEPVERFLADSWSLVERYRDGTLVAPAEQRTSSDRMRALIAQQRASANAA